MFGARAAAEVQQLAGAAAEFRELFDRWPSHAELLAIDASLPRTDAWRHEFDFALADGTLTVRSAGVDGVVRTDDDVVSEPQLATK